MMQETGIKAASHILSAMKRYELLKEDCLDVSAEEICPDLFEPVEECEDSDSSESFS